MSIACAQGENLISQPYRAIAEPPRSMTYENLLAKLEKR
jgi:hypothetical protein